MYGMIGFARTLPIILALLLQLYFNRYIFFSRNSRNMADVAALEEAANKQGLVVRNLKDTKAPKEEIIAAVSTSLPRSVSPNAAYTHTSKGSSRHGGCHVSC
jgi:hypothetical protein